MENDATLTGLAEATEKAQNIKLPALKQSNIESFFWKSSITKGKII